MTGREGLFHARHFLTVETLGKEALLLVRYPKMYVQKNYNRCNSSSCFADGFRAES